jgi:hypothetical protein
VLEKMQAGDPSWEAMIPPEVARIIKERKYCFPADASPAG